MVEIEKVGVMITIFLMMAGLMMTQIAQQEPGETFGMVSDFSTIDVNGDNMGDLLEQFNSDVNQVAKSTPISQISYGASAILTGSRIIFSLFITALTGWTAIINGLFAPIPAPVNLLAIPIKAILAVIMVFTIMKFLGDVVKSLPFFGGG